MDRQKARRRDKITYVKSTGLNCLHNVACANQPVTFFRPAPSNILGVALQA